MATYNKRGYKSPKEKDEKLDGNYIEDVSNVDSKNSTTAKAFDTLDQTASRTEEFVAKNQKAIFGVLAAIVLVTVGYLAYQKFISEPKEETATDDLFVAQQNFQKAIDASTAQDSIFNLVLKGSEGKQGVIEIAKQYSGTDAGNLANYYAGISYLNTGKYTEAIEYLDKFKGNDDVVGAQAKGAIGDAFAQKNQKKEALEYYVKASNYNNNEFTTPMYLMKAGKMALLMGNKADALKYFTTIKDKYETSQEGGSVDALIGMAQ